MERKMIDTVNYKCSAYPCHSKNKLKSCVFCYCPLYPCLNEPIGSKGKWKKLPDGKEVWDCSNCVLPHDRRRVKELFRYLKDNNWLE